MTEEGATRRAERERDSRYLMNNLREPMYEGYHTRTLGERCIVWRHEGPPMVPPAYNDILQIFQTRDYVVVFQEMSNNLPRIIPMDGRPTWRRRSACGRAIRAAAGKATRWLSRRPISTARPTIRARVKTCAWVERFRRVAEDRIHYEWTVQDARTWAQPWTAEIPMVKTDKLMYEYACHEGNHDLPNILSVARNIERQAAEKAQAGSR